MEMRETTLVSDLANLQQRAAAGEAQARYELGARLLVGRDAPFAPQQAHALLAAAADQGDGDALRLMAVLAALGEGGPQSWPAAWAFLTRAAAGGDVLAQAQLDILGTPGEVDAWLAPPAGAVRFETPRVMTFEGFVAPAVCAWIIERARPRLEAARVKNPERGGANTDAYRSNTGMGFSVVDTDVVLQLVHARMAAAMGSTVANQEPTNVLHYEPGQQYRPHFDFLDPGAAHFHRELAALGQRVATFLIYLNDDFDDGETAFLKLDWSFKGRTGDALLFWNVTPDGRPDPLTLHAGTPPSRGEKWLLSKWIRSRAVPLI